MKNLCRKIVQVLQAATTYAGVLTLLRSIITVAQPLMTGAARFISIMVTIIFPLMGLIPTLI